MPLEKLIAEFEKEAEKIRASQARQLKILDQIKNIGKDKDWVSVAEAARLAGVSAPTIYRYIDSGRLRKVRHFGAKKFVSLEEIKNWDDGYGEQVPQH